MNDFQDELIELTQALVRQNSLPGMEAGAAQVVEAKLRALDFDKVRVDENGSVLAERQGARQGPRLLFDAHLDIVPVKNADSWSYDPFAGEVRDGKIWGRGATDIKGGLAALVCALGRLPRRSFAGTLIVSASIGEEHMEGAALRSIVAHTRPDFTVICEPTGCQLGIGQKGRTEIWIQVHGRPAHSSRPELGDNAIYRAVEMILALRDLPIHSDPVMGSGVMELVEIISSPFPGECTVPYGCRMRFDRRLVAGETRESVMQEVRVSLERFPGWEAGYQPSLLNTYTGRELRGEHFYASWLLLESSPWLAKCRKGLQMAGISPQTMVAPYCTNGSFTAGEAGIPTVIFGPSIISLAHVVDEYVEIAELVRAFHGVQGLAQALSLPDLVSS